MTRILLSFVVILATVPFGAKANDSLMDLFVSFEISNEELMKRIDEEADQLFSINLSEESSQNLESKILEFYSLNPEDVFEIPLKTESDLEKSLSEIAKFANNQEFGGIGKLWELVAKAINNFVFTSNHPKLFQASLTQSHYEISLEFSLYEKKLWEAYSKYQKIWSDQLLTSISSALGQDFRDIAAFIGVVREWVLGSYKLSYSENFKKLFFKVLLSEGKDEEVLLERLVKVSIADSHLHLPLMSSPSNELRKLYPELPKDAMYRVALFHKELIETGDSEKCNKSRKIIGALFEKFVERFPKFLGSEADELSYEYISKTFMIVMIRITSSPIFRSFLSLKWKNGDWKYSSGEISDDEKNLVENFEKDYFLQTFIIGGQHSKVSNQILIEGTSQIKRLLPSSAKDVANLRNFHPSFTLDLTISDSEYEVYNALYIAYLNFKVDSSARKSKKAYIDFDLFLDKNRDSVLEFSSEKIDLNEHYIALKLMNLRHFTKFDQKATFVGITEELANKTQEIFAKMKKSPVYEFVHNFMINFFDGKVLEVATWMKLKNFSVNGGLITRFYKLDKDSSGTEEEKENDNSNI